MIQPTDRASLQAAIDSGLPFQSPEQVIDIDRSIVVRGAARIPPMKVRVIGGSEPAFNVQSSDVTMDNVDIYCEGRTPHGIWNASSWDNRLSYFRGVRVYNATSHAAVHDNGDAVIVRDFEAHYCGGAGSFAWDVRNNFINSSIHIAKTDQCGGVQLSKRDVQPEGVDISGKIIPHLGRSGVVVNYGLAIDILPGTIIDQVGDYALFVANGANDVKVTGAYLGGLNGTDPNKPPGNKDAPLITMTGGNQIKLQNLTVQGGASDQLIAFPSVRLLTMRNCDFMNVAPTHSNCNITGLAHTKIMENSFWHARGGGGSLVWANSGEACYAYDNTSYYGNHPVLGAFGADLVITGAALKRDNSRVNLPAGWTH